MHLNLIKHNFLKRKSIPILLKRSIPLMCSLALLLLFCNLFMAGTGIDKTYAEEGEDPSEISNTNNVDNNDSTDADDTGIVTYATTTINPTASLTIGGDATDKQVVVAPGSVAYRKHTVTVEANDIKSYSLILSGPANLASSTNTVISGTTGGFSEINAPEYGLHPMKENTWGYSWSDDALEVGNPSSGYYSALSPDGIVLRGDKVSGYKVNFTKDLFFAAKFAEDAEPGHYTASVNLSLVATPRDVATGFGGILDMQAMTASICNAVVTGTTGSLEDTRDGSVYMVGKLSDGKCWMTQNLRLTKEGVEAYGGSATLTSENTNVVSDYVLPNSKAWTSGDDAVQGIIASTDNDYGAYYTWCAATANTCQTNGLPIEANTNAASSVCPKGWRLPTGGAKGELEVLAKNYPTNYSSGLEWDTVNGKYGHWLGGPGKGDGGAFFPAAGYIPSGKSGASDVGRDGNYWSSTAGRTAEGSYGLGFYSHVLYPATDNNDRRNGLSVRCVAR